MSARMHLAWLKQFRLMRIAYCIGSKTRSNERESPQAEAAFLSWNHAAKKGIANPVPTKSVSFAAQTALFVGHANGR